MSPVVCPLDGTQNLSVEDGELLENPSLCRKEIGKLNFLAHMRPDLAFAIQHLSQFMRQSRVPHFTALMHVLRYLKNQPNLGILLNNQPDFSLTAYCDSD